MKRSIFILLLLAGVGASCRNRSVELSRALELSGQNRPEMEQVLEHYASDPADSLKLRAAVFLIENMPGHHALAGDPLAEYMRVMDSLHPGMPHTVRRVVASLPLREPDFTARLTPVYDIETITAPFLIAHIDNLLECRERVTWLKELSFGDFCEYVLPYRAGNEPLDDRPDSTRTTWRGVLEQMFHYTDLPQTLENAMSLQKALAGNRDDPYLQDLQTPSGLYTFDCIDRSYYDIHCFRGAGVASAVDFIPHWATRNGQHCWSVVIDPERIHSNLSDTRNPRAAKVFRKTYSRNPLPEPVDPAEYVPELFRDPFNRDVTPHYANVTDVSVPLELPAGRPPQYAYLCVFNNLEWQPIAWAPVRRGKAVFRDLGVNLVYLPVCYRGDERIQAGYPFHLSADGKATPFVPDTTRQTRMRFTRKYPLTYSKTQWTRNLVGTCFEGSDDPDFRSGDTLHIVRTTSPDLNWTTVPLDPDKSYRYWRAGKSGRYLNFGELEFLDPDGRPLSGTILSAAFDEKAGAAFDGNILTYNHSLDWIGMDFGRPVSLSAIRYICRTDGNGIFPGDSYELLYHGPDGWQCAGLVEAETDEIRFGPVPSGALYWLRNLSEGQEERIFSYENGRRSFW